MPLNQQMLQGCKDIIYNKSKLPESVKEPVHIAVTTIISLEYSYRDFLSREVCGANRRADSIRVLINLHGGDVTEFDNWFEYYEGVDSHGVESMGAEAMSVWGS